MNFLVGMEKTSVGDVSEFCKSQRVGLAVLTIQFFERQLLRFADETEDHNPGDQVETSVKADCRMSS